MVMPGTISVTGWNRFSSRQLLELSECLRSDMTGVAGVCSTYHGPAQGICIYEFNELSEGAQKELSRVKNKYKYLNFEINKN